MVIVEPRNGYPTKVDREFAAIQSEFYTKPDPQHRKVGGAPLYVLDTDRVRTKAQTYTVFNGRYNGLVDHLRFDEAREHAMSVAGLMCTGKRLRHGAMALAMALAAAIPQTSRACSVATGIFVCARGGRACRHRGFRVWQTHRRPAGAPDGDSDHAGRIADDGTVSARDAGADRSLAIARL